jgi:hypothetical protein
MGTQEFMNEENVVAILGFEYVEPMRHSVAEVPDFLVVRGSRQAMEAYSGIRPQIEKVRWTAALEPGSEIGPFM